MSEYIFVIEDNILKVKWRNGDKHYIVPLFVLLELWEEYKEQVGKLT